MESPNVTLGEAATQFLANLSPEEREAAQKEVHKFVRWYGRSCPIGGLTIPNIDDYAEKAALGGGDSAKNLEPVKSFLSYARKQGMIKTGLSAHLKPKKLKSSDKVKVGTKNSHQAEAISEEGLAKLKAELSVLQQERHVVADELRTAAADKDFRENAPLDAARDKQGHLEGRIRKIESLLTSAVVMDESRKSRTKLEMGKTALIRDVSSGEEVRYTLVHASEVNLAKGKISTASPLGKALLGRAEGEVVQVVAPGGTMEYQIVEIAA